MATYANGVKLLDQAQDGSAAAPAVTFFNDPNTGFFRPAADDIGVSLGGSQKVLFDSSGSVFIGDTANTEMTVGLLVNQGANTDEILTLQDNRTQPATDQAEADTMLTVRNFYEAAAIWGFADAGQTRAIHIHGVSDTPNSTKSAAGSAPFEFRAFDVSGAALANMTSGENLALFRNNATVIWILDASGASWQSGSSTYSASVDSASVADQVTLGGYEAGAGNRVLAISQETAVAAEVDETKFSHKMECRINGATYYIMLTQT